MVFYISVISLRQKFWEIHNLYSYHFDRIKFRNIYRKKYFQAKKKLNIVYKKAGYDLIIIGSDEVWQLNNPTVSIRPEYWGMNLNAKKIITYAVCANGATANEIEKYPFIKQGISRIQAFSFRDKKTYEAFSKLIPNEKETHVDPTFLIRLSKYTVASKQRKPYLLVYTYGFTEDKIKKTIAFARLKGLRIIAAGNKFDWCDESIPASPFEFLGLIKEAAYVVTDTFHGTVLSTHFEKQFFTFANDKEKVLQFIKEFGLEDRNASVVSTLAIIAENPIDYTAVNMLLKTAIDNSQEYLTAFLEE